MSRRITDAGAAVKPPKGAKAPKSVKTDGPAEPQDGVVFIKNQRNELLKFEDGSSYKFPESRVLITDPTLIANIRATAERYGVFEQTT